MTINYEVLRAELTTDSKQLGYADLIAKSDFEGLRGVLSSATGPGAATINLTYVTKNGFLSGTASATLNLSSASITIQGKWDRILAHAHALDSFNPSEPSNAYLLGLAITDGIITQPQIDSFTKRVGSRYEVLFGQDEVPTETDLKMAVYSADGRKLI